LKTKSCGFGIIRDATVGARCDEGKRDGRPPARSGRSRQLRRCAGNDASAALSAAAQRAEFAPADADGRGAATIDVDGRERQRRPSLAAAADRGRCSSATKNGTCD
jgi:hypothetical protein